MEPNNQDQQNQFQQDQYQWDRDEQYQWYQEGQYQQTQYQQAPNPGQGEESRDPNFERDLIFSIIHLVFCPFLRTIPLILTFLAHRAWKQGRLETHERLNKIVRVFLIFGWITIGVMAVAVIGGMIYIFGGLVTSGF